MGAALVVAPAVGCGGRGEPQSMLAQNNSRNIQRLASMYVAFQMKNEWSGPTDREALQSFLQGLRPEKLTRIGIDPNGIDGLFVGERDGKPFAIRYGVPGSSRGPHEPVVFESVGVDGLRMVAYLDGTLEELDSQQYEELLRGGYADSRGG